LTFVFLFSVSSAVLAAGACQISRPVGFDGIGDGCTVTYKGKPVAPPDIYVFQSLFTPACDRHDACYSSLGGTYDLCDNKMLADMRGLCRGKFSPWFPVELGLCLTTAQNYYNGVVYVVRPFNDIQGLQRNAVARLEILKSNLNTFPVQNKCSTTEGEQTNLFNPELISAVYSIFSSAVGRAPTIFEFVEATLFKGSTNLPVIYENYASWENLARSYAASRRPFPVATNVAFSSNGFNFTLPTPTPGTQYVWVINGFIGYGSTVSVPIPEQPLYDTTYVLNGSVYGSNGYQENKNIATVTRTVKLKGSCSPRPGIACL
jgi:hypothetical protein